MPDGGRLTLATATHIDRTADGTHHYVALSVADTGSGMPPDVLARACEPFFTTKGVGKGTGLGLSMVYGFLKQSGGRVEIASELGAGTTITLLLPRAEEEEEGIPHSATLDAVVRSRPSVAPPRAATG
jgi:signal transduction histidine kinase